MMPAIITHGVGECIKIYKERRCAPFMDNLINFSDYSKNDIFNYAVENGIFDVRAAFEDMQMKERDRILQEHDRKVWQGKDGRWRTKVIVDGKEKLLCKTYREDLENAIIESLRQEQYNPTVNELYKMWMAGKIKNEEITETTVNRYDRQYKQCSSEFGKKHVKNVTPWDLEQHIRSAIHDHKLTSKGYSNYRIIIRGMFKFAKNQGLIDWSISNTIADMDISKKSFRVIRHTDDELVFTDDEKQKIEEAIAVWGYDVINLAILLLFKSGCRPGEAVAATNENLSVSSFNVDRTEIELRDAAGRTWYEVACRAKTDAGYRDIPIPESASWIIKRCLLLNPTGEYVFVKNGKRINERQLRDRLRRLCKKVETTHKSPNKIRKTYVSELMEQGVSPSIVTKVVGHTDIRTTERYYFKNRFSDEEIAKRINAVNL